MKTSILGLPVLTEKKRLDLVFEEVALERNAIVFRIHDDRWFLAGFDHS